MLVQHAAGLHACQLEKAETTLCKCLHGCSGTEWQDTRYGGVICRGGPVNEGCRSPSRGTMLVQVLGCSSGCSVRAGLYGGPQDAPWAAGTGRTQVKVGVEHCSLQVGKPQVAVNGLPGKPQDLRE